MLLGLDVLVLRSEFGLLRREICLQWFGMVGSFPNFTGVHSLGLLASFLDYFADD